MTHPFVIYGLPRSRTFWLSRFLSYGGWHCGHDEIRHARSMEDVEVWFRQPLTGTSETAAAPWWRLLGRVAPSLRTVVVRRPVVEVVDSLMELNVGFNRPSLEQGMRRLNCKLDQIEARVPGVLSVRFRDLVDESVCGEVLEYCLELPRDPKWWDMLAPMNLQTDMLATLRYCEAFRGQMAKLSKIARHREIAAMRRVSECHDGITIQQEPFDTFFRDGRGLFSEHLTQVGEAPDAYWEKNLDLMRAIEGLGFMQIVTARSNGRMFGYLMAVLSPSLEKNDTLSATHLTFFAAPGFPGLGLKLQRASVEGLRNKGVDELFLREGVRGSGPRLGALYRRMGAEEFGNLYRLNLKRAA